MKKILLFFILTGMILSLQLNAQEEIFYPSFKYEGTSYGFDRQVVLLGTAEADTFRRVSDLPTEAELGYTPESSNQRSLLVQGYIATEGVSYSEMDAYCILNAVDIASYTDYNKFTATFWTKALYANVTFVDISVLATNNYTGDVTTTGWTDVTSNLDQIDDPTVSDALWTKSTLDISDWSSANNLVLAFRYNIASSGTYSNVDPKDRPGKWFFAEVKYTGEVVVDDPTAGEDVVTACDSYTWMDGVTYSSSNNTARYTIEGGASDGGDSLVVLNLTINSVSDITASIDGNTIQSNNSNGSYIWLDCDDSFGVIQGETGISFAPSISGNYAVEISENGCVDTSECVSFVTTGIIENSLLQDLTVYPNPTSGNLRIEFNEVQSGFEVELYTLTGQRVETKRIDNSSGIEFDIVQPNGVYLLNIINDEGNRTVLRIVKN